MAVLLQKCFRDESDNRVRIFSIPYPCLPAGRAFSENVVTGKYEIQKKFHVAPVPIFGSFGIVKKG